MSCELSKAFHQSEFWYLSLFRRYVKTAGIGYVIGRSVLRELTGPVDSHGEQTAGRWSRSSRLDMMEHTSEGTVDFPEEACLNAFEETQEVCINIVFCSLLLLSGRKVCNAPAFLQISSHPRGRRRDHNLPFKVNETEVKEKEIKKASSLEKNWKKESIE